MEYFDWTETQADTRPDKVAMINVADDRRVTYADLYARSGRLAGFFQQNGITEGERVAILALNGPEYFEIQFANAKIGGITVPLNWRLTENELAYICGDCAPKILVHDERFAPMAQALQERCGIETLLEIDVENGAEAAKASSYEQAIAEETALHEGHPDAR